jgi:CRISPR/Cas system-associated endonuclease Cas3-HD
MNHRTKRQKWDKHYRNGREKCIVGEVLFLIELLVVIAVIAILMSNIEGLMTRSNHRFAWMKDLHS